MSKNKKKEITITLNIDNLEEEAAPLYKKYPGQAKEQEAYVYLDQYGNVTVDYEEEGGVIPLDVWNGLTIRFDVSPYVNGKDLKDFLESPETLDILQKIHERHRVYRNGNNDLVGRVNEEGRELIEILEQRLSQLDEDQVWDAYDFIMEDHTLLSQLALEESVEALSQKIEAEAQDNGVVLYGNVGEAVAQRCAELLEKDLKREEYSVLTYAALKLNEYDSRSYGRLIEAVRDELELALDDDETGDKEKEELSELVEILKSSPSGGAKMSM